MKRMLMGAVVALVLAGCGSSPTAPDTVIVDVPHFAGYREGIERLEALREAGWSCEVIERLYDLYGRESGVRYECRR